MLKKIWNQFQRKRKITGYGGIMICVVFAYALLLNSIPDKMYVEYGEKPDYSFGVPVTETVVQSREVFANQQNSRDSAVHMTPGLAGNTDTAIYQDTGASSDTALYPDTRSYQDTGTYSGSGPYRDTGSYQVVCKLFGAIPVKQISVQEVSKKELIPAGTNIGIYVRNEQIMIIGTGEVTDESGVKREPAKNVVRSGDYILAVDGEEMETKDQLVKKISFCNGEKITLKLLRGGEEIEVSIKPARSQDGIYQLGIWVRDDIAGVGTLTYITDKGDYGALGHGITDADVGSLIDVKKGSIYETTILEIRKGQRGQPGEMSGMINYKDEYKLGTIEENTNVGIYGSLTNMPEGMKRVSAMPVTYKEGIKKGKAEIISSVEGSRRAYEIEIEQTDYHSEGNNKGIQFQVTDEKLLEDTGGIIQGMSGSPITQNGHIIGAVTHVFISDSKMGYGIFIENMLEH